MSDPTTTPASAAAEPAARPEPPELCSKCQCPITFAHNVDTLKDGPIDLRTAVYMVRKGVDRQGKLLSMTGKRLMERLVSLTVLVDGEPVTYTKDEILGFFVGHFTTCPSREFFSRKGGR